MRVVNSIRTTSSRKTHITRRPCDYKLGWRYNCNDVLPFFHLIIVQYCQTQHCLKVALNNSRNPPILVSFANRGCKKGMSQLPIRLILNGVYGLPQAFFIERVPHSYTRHTERESRGERDIVPSTQDGGHAYVA
jgi:hypothetical protein